MKRLCLLALALMRVSRSTAITLFKSGRELGSELTIKIPEAPGSLLIKYRRVR